MLATLLASRKSIATILAEEEAEGAGGGLARTLSASSLVGIGVGATIGAGIFVLTGTAAAQFAGPGLAISFVIAGIASALVGLCYAELAAMIPAPGSTYTYTYATLGSLAAWIIGWDLVLEFAMAASAIAVGWSGYAQSLAGDFGLRLPAALASAPGRGGLIDLPAVAITLALTMVLMRPARDAALWNALMVALKIIIIIGFILVGAVHVRPELWSPPVPPNEGSFGAFGWSGILRGAGVVFFSYVGFETVSCAAAETRHPQRDAPIGLIGSLIVSTMLYVAVAVVLTGLVSYRDLNVADPIAKAIDTMQLAGFALIIKIGALIGLTTACLTALYGQGRISYAMARDRMLPDAFAKVDPGTQVPRFGQAAIGLLTALVAGFVPIEILGELVSIGTLFAFILVCASVLILRRTEPDRARPFRVPGGRAIPTLGILACLALVAGLPADTWIRLIGWLALGLAIYFGYGRHRLRASAAAEQPASRSDAARDRRGRLPERF